MLVKVEGTILWANFEQVFEDVDKAEEKAEQLRASGWIVKETYFHSLTLEQYCAEVVKGCFAELERLYGIKPIREISH